MLGALMVAASFSVNGQSLKLVPADTSLQAGAKVDLPVRVFDFEKIVSAQFSILWDPSVLKYVDFKIADLDYVGVGDSDAEKGILRLSWFDVEGKGQSLADSSSFVDLQFEGIGNSGDSTYVAIAGKPLKVQIFQITSPSVYDSVMVALDSGLVKLTAQAQFSFVVRDVVCFGDKTGGISTNGNGSEGFNFTWTGPSGFSAATPSVSNLPAGAYKLVIRNKISNEILVDTTLNIMGPTLALGFESLAVVDSKCGQPDGQVTVKAQGGTPPYAYDIGQGGQNLPTFSGLPSGAYTLKLTDAKGCRADSNIIIKNADGPKVDLGADLTVCDGKFPILDAGEHSQYQWSTGAITRTIEINQAGMYSVTVSNASNCQASDSIRIVSGEKIDLILLNPRLEICPGDSLQLFVDGGASYRWVDTSGTLSSIDVQEPIAYPRTTTLYTVISESENCGKDSLAIEIVVAESKATAGIDTCVALGESITLQASGGRSYKWFPSVFPLSADDIPNPSVEPDSTVLFMVEIIDFLGCKIVDSVEVVVVESFLDIKGINMITPNDDGKNDVLEFNGLGKLSNNFLRVYNRWGDLIYEKENYQTDTERFDGTYKGKPLPAGNYFYVLSFRIGSLKKTLTIVRP